MGEINLKELLAESSIVIIILFVAIYLCGSTYYTSLLHSYELGIYFILPWENGIEKGVGATVPLIVVVFISTSAGRALELVFAKFQLSEWKFSNILKHTAHFATAIVCGLSFLKLAEIGGLHLLAVDTSRKWWLRILVSLTALIAWYVDSEHRKKRRNDTTEKGQIGWHTYACFPLLFVITSTYYSALLGKSIVPVINRRPRARITFTEVPLQQAYANSYFIPLLEKGDDIVLIQFPDFQPLADNAARRGQLAIIKKTSIQAIDFSDNLTKP